MRINQALITHYLEAMVRLDSVNPDLVPTGAGEADIAAWLAETCTHLGLEVTLQEAAANRPNVIARWRGTGDGKSLLLTGHIDTVGVENMDIPPFEPRIEDGKLYGRGSFDMKGGLATILGTVAALKELNFQPHGDLILGFVTDEEAYSIGTDKLVEAVQADAAILTEPTSLKICIAHKGFAWLTVTTKGKAAHGSLYKTGEDAILRMRPVLDVLDQFENNLFRNREHPLLGRPSVHASTIHGGIGWSTYPDQCTLQVEHRLLPDETAQATVMLWQGALRQLGEKYPHVEAEVKLDFERPGYEIPQDAPIVQAVGSAFQSVTDQAPIYAGAFGWLDSAILGGAGIPTVIFGPGGQGAHAAIEFVNLEDVFRCTEVLVQAAQDWLS